MPHFEIKRFGENDWRRVSEKVFLNKLIENVEIIYPILIEMFKGEEIVIHEYVYRIQDT